MTLADQVADCLERHKLTGTAGIVAVSGGPDSVALTYLLADFLKQGGLERLIFAHVNHLLRGDESDADEAFVQNLADERMEVRTTRIDVAAIAKSERENLEAVARRERYHWLTELARNENAAWIATGHNADDQAETVLFRLLRGSGVLGLSGMPESRPLDTGVMLIRPLLSVRRQAILDFLRDRQIAYRIDSTNADARFTRNRLRNELLPLLVKEYNPAIVDILCRLAEQARELSAEAARQAQRLLAEAELPRAGNMLVFSLEKLHPRPANDLREMFRLVWQREGWPMAEMDFPRWQRLADVVNGTVAAWDFPGKIQARRVGRVVQISP